MDPYYLTQKAERLGYHPQVILAGRRINDGMGKYVAEQTVKLLVNQEVSVRQARVAVLGITFKENVPDIRNSKVVDIVRELSEYGMTCAGPRSAGVRRGDAARIRTGAVPGIGHRRVRRRHPGGGAQGVSRKGRRLDPLAAAPAVAVGGDGRQVRAAQRGPAGDGVLAAVRQVRRAG